MRLGLSLSICAVRRVSGAGGAYLPPAGTPALMADFVVAPAVAFDLWFAQQDAPVLTADFAAQRYEGPGIDPSTGTATGWYSAAVVDTSTGERAGRFEIWS